MKKIVLFLISLFFVTIVSSQDLIKVDGLISDDKGSIFSGIFNNYYENNTLKNTFYIKNGKIEGKAITYHKNGKIFQILSYKNGLFDGESKSFDENGVITGIGHYKKGKKIGTWLVFSEGYLYYKIEYDRNKKTVIKINSTLAYK